MKELREILVKDIINAKTDEEIDRFVLETICLLRRHMVNEFVIAQFINKLTTELAAQGFDNDYVFIKIRLLHPTGLQWQFG